LGEFAKRRYEQFIEINFIKMKGAVEIIGHPGYLVEQDHGSSPVVNAFGESDEGLVPV